MHPMHDDTTHQNSRRPAAAAAWCAAPLALALTLILLSPAAQAASIYLCKAYNGGSFWSSAHCREHGALIDRIESVPDRLPFDQQVSLAEQARARAAGLYQAPAPVQQGSVTHHSTHTVVVDGQMVHATGQGKAAECKALEARITQLDNMARQPQTGQMQDWIRDQKSKARDRQFGLRC